MRMQSTGLLLFLAATGLAHGDPASLATSEGDYVARDFQFANGVAADRW